MKKLATTILYFAICSLVFTFHSYSKQHKISRYAGDWPLDPEHQKDNRTAITID